jgi:hypothetical protein
MPILAYSPVNRLRNLFTTDRPRDTMGWKGDSPVMTVEEPATVRIVSNDETDIFVEYNARYHEVFVSHEMEGRYNGVSIFTGIACREIATALMDAADWLDTLPAEDDHD